MTPSVRDAFFDFSVPLEGFTTHMYCDVKGLVTTAIGLLIDPIEYALRLPWQLSDGTLASRDAIAAEWATVKAKADWAMHGGMVYTRITKLRLTRDAVRDLTNEKLAQNDAVLVRRFPDFAEWPADAQMGIHSLSWACGPAFRFPKLEAALRERDFVTAAEECRMNERGNAGLIERNARNQVLLSNADCVERHGLDRDVLYWPADLSTTSPEAA